MDFAIADVTRSYVPSPSAFLLALKRGSSHPRFHTHKDVATLTKDAIQDCFTFFEVLPIFRLHDIPIKRYSVVPQSFYLSERSAYQVLSDFSFAKLAQAAF